MSPSHKRLQRINSGVNSETWSSDSTSPSTTSTLSSFSSVSTSSSSIVSPPRLPPRLTHAHAWPSEPHLNYQHPSKTTYSSNSMPFPSTIGALSSPRSYLALDCSGSLPTFLPRSQHTQENPSPDSSAASLPRQNGTMEMQRTSRMPTRGQGTKQERSSPKSSKPYDRRRGAATTALREEDKFGDRIERLTGRRPRRWTTPPPPEVREAAIAAMRHWNARNDFSAQYSTLALYPSASEDADGYLTQDDTDHFA